MLRIGAMVCASWCAISTSAMCAEVIVPNTSTWKWLHPTDGVDPANKTPDFHRTFHTADFDDSKWKSGTDKPGPNGGFGYGEANFQGVDIGVPKASFRKSAYFRLKFNTDKDYDELVFKCQRDDAIIVYLDGREVFRNNLPLGNEAYGLSAEKTISSSNETRVNSFRIERDLPAGEHILAISLHNQSGTSSDLRIAEISLEGSGRETVAAGD